MNKIMRRQRRKRGIRKDIYGTIEKPRITIYKSNKHIYVQAIDDYTGNTIAGYSDFKIGKRKNIEVAFAIGKKLAESLSRKDVKKAIYDRNGYIYHGLVKSVAEGVRKGGIRV